MPEYTVTYQIDVDAPDAVEAARYAHRIIKDDTDPGQHWTYDVALFDGKNGDAVRTLLAPIATVTLDRDSTVLPTDSHWPSIRKRRPRGNRVRK